MNSGRDAVSIPYAAAKNSATQTFRLSFNTPWSTAGTSIRLTSGWQIDPIRGALPPVSSPCGIPQRKITASAAVTARLKHPGRKNAQHTPMRSIRKKDTARPATFPTQMAEPRMDTAAVFLSGGVLAQTVRSTGPHSMDCAYPFIPQSRQNTGKGGSSPKSKLLRPIVSIPAKIACLG